MGIIKSKLFLFSILICFLLGPKSVFALEDFQVSESHNFVANVASRVSPSVVRIDIEREMQTDEFESDLLDPLLRDLLGDLGTLPKNCLLYTSPSPRDQRGSRMPSSA